MGDGGRDGNRVEEGRDESSTVRTRNSSLWQFGNILYGENESRKLTRFVERLNMEAIQDR